ncbi:MAG: hypothetical protein Q9200_002455 [Gallowayella weberi]
MVPDAALKGHFEHDDSDTEITEFEDAQETVEKEETVQPKKKRNRPSTAAKDADDIQAGLLWVGKELKESEQSQSLIRRPAATANPPANTATPPARSAARQRAALGEVNTDTPTDQKIIELGNAPMTHAQRHKKAPMVWDLRGRMRKEFFFMLDRNKGEEFWSIKCRD